MADKFAKVPPSAVESKALPGALLALAIVQLETLGIDSQQFEVPASTLRRWISLARTAGFVTVNGTQRRPVYVFPHNAGQFAKVPSGVIKALVNNAPAFKVYCMLRLSTPKGLVKIETIATKYGMPKRTVRRGIHDLAEKGLITVKKRFKNGQRRANGYSFPVLPNRSHLDHGEPAESLTRGPRESLIFGPREPAESLIFGPASLDSPLERSLLETDAEPSVQASPPDIKASRKAKDMESSSNELINSRQFEPTKEMMKAAIDRRKGFLLANIITEETGKFRYHWKFQGQHRSYAEWANSWNRWMDNAEAPRESWSDKSSGNGWLEHAEAEGIDPVTGEPLVKATANVADGLELEGQRQ